MSSKESLLHYWLSEKKHATRQQLRRAWKGLSPAESECRKMSQSMNRLWRAGHIEFDPPGNATICPPVIVLANQCSAFASGARSLALRRHLLESFPDSNFICRPNQCEIWTLSGNLDSIHTVAEKLNLSVVDDKGVELLRSLPDYGRLLNEIEPSEELVASSWWQAFWHHREGYLLWKETSSTVKTGIYRAKYGYQWKYAFRLESGAIKLLTTFAERAAGLWDCLRDQTSSVSYITESCSLQICPGLLPPVLLDRALRMASGTPPERKHGELHYSGIDLARAQECARLLCTPLQIE